MKSYSDIATDGGSRIVEQVIQQRAKVEENLSSVRHIVAIGSGKGGVGKSTLTMQLALSLSRKDLKISVLDADFNGPSLSMLSGVRNPLLVPAKNGFVVPQTKSGIGVVSFGGIFAEPQVVSFESVSKGESYVWRATKEFSVLGEILAGADWGKLDALLIDLPPGVERTLQFAEYLGPRAKFALVTIPSDVSRGVVARSITALKETGTILLGYVENMSGYFCSECKKVKPLFPSLKKVELGIPFLGSVPFDPELAELCDQGTPLTQFKRFYSLQAVEGVSENIWNAL